MLLLRVSDSSGDELGEPPLPLLLPPIERQNFRDGRSQAVETDRGKHARSSGIEMVEAGVSEGILLSRPAEPG